MALSLPALAVVGYILFRGQSSSDAEGREVARFVGHHSPIRCLALSADGKIVASVDDMGTLCVWHSEGRDECCHLPNLGQGPHSIALSADGKKVAVCGVEPGVRMWDLDRPSEVTHLQDQGHTFTSLAFYPAQSHLLTGGPAGLILLWDLKSKRPVRRFSISSGEVRALAFTPDGKRFLVGDSLGNLRLWDLEPGHESLCGKAYGTAVSTIALDSEGRQAAVCAAKSAAGGLPSLWSVDSLQPLTRMAPTVDEATSSGVALSPGGTRALSGDSAGRLRLWSCESGEVLETFAGGHATITCCAFLPNGLIALSGSTDSTIRLWRLPPSSERELKRLEEAIEAARRRRDVWELYGKRIQLARDALKAKQAKEALVDLRAALVSVPVGSFEFTEAQTAIRKIEDGLQKQEQVRTASEAGEAAAKKRNFSEALEHFGHAKQILDEPFDISADEVSWASKDRDSAREEVQRGIEKIQTALDTKNSLESAKFVQTLGFEHPLPNPFALRDPGTIAFLLTSDPPPMAQAADPLAWHLQTDLDVEWPDERAVLRVIFSRDNDDKPIAVVDRAFRAHSKHQAFDGRAQPPPGGWSAGKYKIATVLITDDGEKPRGEPRYFDMGLIHWNKKTFELTPQAAIESHFSIDTGFELDRGDPLAIVATGSMTPATLDFYRELLSDRHLAAPVAAKPTGIAWSSNDQILRRFRVVEMTANYAAVLWKFSGQEWVPYDDAAHPLPSPRAGNLRLSLNLVLGPRKSEELPTSVSKLTGLARLAAETGHFSVAVFHGRFDFPRHLSFLEQAALLRNFSTGATDSLPDGNPSPEPK
ncbi:MAG TPA: hypothetical protein VHX65_14230 [Pirellulales bacterium]|nr:hypothetical protein [Pirellulales bacterium]